MKCIYQLALFKNTAYNAQLTAGRFQSFYVSKVHSSCKITIYSLRQITITIICVTTSIIFIVITIAVNLFYLSTIML